MNADDDFDLIPGLDRSPPAPTASQREALTRGFPDAQLFIFANRYVS